MWIIDTDVAVDVLRGDEGSEARLADLERRGPLAITCVTAHELWQGAHSSSDPETAAAGVEEFLSAFDVLPYDRASALVGGRLAAELRAAGTPVGDLDTMIAASVLSNKATLVTRNLKHFRRVEELSIHAL